MSHGDADRLATWDPHESRESQNVKHDRSGDRASQIATLVPASADLGRPQLEELLGHH
jgi:hypothetical protein